MQELALYLVKALVSQPDAVSIEVVEEADATVFNIKTAQEDAGRVIGREGKTANAIRTILRGAAGRTGKKMVVKFL